VRLDPITLSVVFRGRKTKDRKVCVYSATEFWVGLCNHHKVAIKDGRKTFMSAD
jgi:hypothetical protein